MKLTKIDEKQKEDYYKRINLNGSWKLADMREDPVKFAKFMLGITPRDYQMVLFDAIEKYDKIGVVKARQIGFSTSIALYCLWFAWFKKAQTGVNKDTKICVISKDDDAAKKLLQQIKDFLYLGDKFMSNFLKGKKEWSSQLFSSKITINNVDMLKFDNGSIIYSFPPTGKVRGTSNDILFIDEFAFLNTPDKERFFYTDALPTISQTNGKIIISSTPNGYGDLFYDIIDPEEKKGEKNMFKTFAFDYTINSDEGYVTQVKFLQEKLDEVNFRQEYCCDFTQNAVTFFNSKKVKDCFDETVSTMNLDNYEYIAGIDYGMTEARTVITLCTQIDGKIYRMYYKEFESGWDINGVIPFMQGLMDRFKINKIVVDYCPQGDAINKKMIEMGWNIEEFDFHTQKEQAYCALRNRINKGEVKLAPDSATEKQMLEMEQEETKMGKLSIHKPRSGRDDILDSLVMSCHNFLETTSQLKVYLV